MSELERNWIDIPEGRMPVARLQEEMTVIGKSLNEIYHGPERRNQLQLRMGIIATEIWCRRRDGELEIVDKKGTTFA
jgi:hypothetical protein